jgi:mRNA deadenylase 3'-5' endonuclease subunit Ccr4
MSYNILADRNVRKDMVNNDNRGILNIDFRSKLIVKRIKF